MTSERIRELLVEPHEFARWLRALPEKRWFQCGSPGLCPIAEFLLASGAHNDLAVYTDCLFPDASADLVDLPQWTKEFIHGFDGDRNVHEKPKAAALAVLERVCPEVA